MLSSRKQKIALVEFLLDEFLLLNGAMSKQLSRFVLLLAKILVLNLPLEALSLLEKEPESAHNSIIL
jgi:hypothetical protein